jgi:hypothetical protein
VQPHEDSALLIRAGRLKFLLHADQQLVHDKFVAWRKNLVAKRRNDEKLGGKYPRIFVVDCSRRYGKDWLGLSIMCAVALQKKNAELIYGAAHRREIEAIINSAALLKKLTSEFPLDCKPVYKTGYKGQPEGLYFPNGSVVRLVGIDLNPDGLRGTGADGICISEAAFCGDLDRTVETVLLPQFMGREDAFLIMNSTPPEAGGHPWDVEFVPDAKDRDAYVLRTIWDAPQYPDQEKFEFLGIDGDEVNRICAERQFTPQQRKSWLDAGCPISDDTFLVKPRQQREYLCIRTREETTVVIPEFSEKKHVKEFEIPPYTHGYTVIDPGVKDLCAINLIAWDFVNARMLVFDEYTKRNANTLEIVEAIRTQEHAHWSKHEGYWHESGLKPNPYMRFSDVDLRMVTDMQQLHGLSVALVQKDDAEAALHALRDAFQNNKIWIHPRCKNTIEHLAGAVWNKARSSYQRSERLGHADHVDVLKYALRSIARSKNPIPPPGWLAVRSQGRGKMIYKDFHLRQPNSIREKLGQLFPSTWSRKH